MNTGPKGVLNDYRIAKEREEQRMKEKRERDIESIEKGSMTTSTVRDDEKRKKAEMVDEMDDDDLDALGTTLTRPTSSPPKPMTPFFL